jgi:hypothetical protein
VPSVRSVGPHECWITLQTTRHFHKKVLFSNAKH